MKIIFIILLSLSISATDFSQSVCKQITMRDLVRKSDVVVVGEVQEANLSKDIVWPPGASISEKAVKYKIVKILKGSFTENNISVFYSLFKGAKWVTDDTPQLSPPLFKNGNRHILMLEKNTFPDRDIASENKKMLGNNAWYYPVCDSKGLLDFNERTESEIIKQGEDRP